MLQQLPATPACKSIICLLESKLRHVNTIYLIACCGNVCVLDLERDDILPSAAGNDGYPYKHKPRFQHLMQFVDWNCQVRCQHAI